MLEAKKRQIRKRFDLQYTPFHNFVTDCGFATACAMTLEIMPGGLLYCAPPCCSYCWLSSSKHRRCRARPMGDEGIPWVQLHNCIGTRLALVMMLAMVRRVHVFLEHPRGSSIQFTPWLQSLMQIHSSRVGWQWGQCYFFFGEFGSWSPKPSLAITTCPWIGELSKRASRVTKNVRKAPFLTKHTS